MKRTNIFAASFFLLIFCASSFAQQSGRWSEEKANAWYAQQPWLVGSNYIPKSAINELEMWQEPTFDPTQIEKELDLGRSHRHEHHARLPA